MQRGKECRWKLCVFQYRLHLSVLVILCVWVCGLALDSVLISMSELFSYTVMRNIFMSICEMCKICEIICIF
jgi:hypothetical protein